MALNIPEPATVLGLPAHKFLRDHWQKAPLTASQAIDLPAIAPTLRELQGLAGNAEVDSRIVIGPDDQGSWEVHHGPFELEEFQDLPAAGWTLLIQDLDKWWPELADLWACFDPIPRWRRDDIMISFAAPGGSVGPHVDRYDVFLAQWQGQRLWTTGNPGPALDPRLTDELKLCELEQPISHPIAGPGDVLYLPPGHAHHGVAVTECLTLSFGMRAPTMAEAVLEFAQEQAQSGGDALYSDPDLGAPEAGSWLHEAAVERFRTLLRKGLNLDSPDFADWVARLLTTYAARREAPEPREMVERNQLIVQLKQGRAAAWCAWSQHLGIAGTDQSTLVVDGVSYNAAGHVVNALLQDHAIVWHSNLGDECLALMSGFLQSGQMIWCDQ